MTELTTWLLERIAEQEAAIRAGGHGWIEVEQYIVRASDGPIVFTEERALARCAADRRIVELHERIGQFCVVCSFEDTSPDVDAMVGAWPCGTLRALASVYAGEPGWREEWA